jgi:hypothetical protein
MFLPNVDCKRERRVSSVDGREGRAKVEGDAQYSPVYFHFPSSSSLNHLGFGSFPSLLFALCFSSTCAFNASALSTSPCSNALWSGRRRESVGARKPSSMGVSSLSWRAKREKP